MVKLKKKFACFVLSLCIVWSIIDFSVIAGDTIQGLGKTSMRVQVSAEEGETVSKNVSTGEIKYYRLETSDNEDFTTSISPGYIPPSLEKANENMIAPFSIIGEDGRKNVNPTTSFPYCSIAYIETSWPNGSETKGTAWMLSQDAAVTAGHCVYASEYGGWADSIKIWPGKDGYGLWNNPYGTANATEFYTDKNYIENGNSDFDWGIIELDEDIGFQTGWLGLYYSQAGYTNTEVTISGYPGDHQYYQYEMQGVISSCTNNKLYYDIDTFSGQSGSPIFTYNHFAIGIHTNGIGGIHSKNSGTRITESLYDFFMTFRPTIQFSTSRTTYYSGENIELKIYGARNADAWVGLYPENVTDYKNNPTGMWCYIGSGTQTRPDNASPDLTVVHLEAATKNVNTGLTYALKPGKYKFVLFAEGGYEYSTSQSFTVGGSSVSAVRDGDGKVVITYTGAVRGDAWVGIYNENAAYGPRNESVVWRPTSAASGTITLNTTKLHEGNTYDVYLFADGGYTEIAYCLLRY